MTTAIPLISHVALFLGFLLAASMAAQVIRRQRSPAGTVAWLLVIILLPYVGVPLYLMFGGRKMSKQAGRKADLKLVRHERELPEALRLMDRLFRSYDLPGVSLGNKVWLCQTGEEIYQSLMDLIDRATESIHITTYIFGTDEVGRSVMERLAKRAAEGVDVRLNLDDLGCMNTTRRFLRPLLEAGGRVSYFMPVLHLPFRGRANLRNHRKMVIVDERWVLAGGTNIAEEYIGPEPMDGRWRDMAFVLEGPAARDYDRIFVADWEFACGEKLELKETPLEPVIETEKGAVVQIIPSGPDVPGDFLYDCILSAIFEARKRLWVVTPYFVPDETLTKALQIAAHRGVDVRVIVPARSNHRLADLAGRQAMRDIQEAGCRVLFYNDGMLHAKVMLVDSDLAVIGSANMDMRSLLLNYEVQMFAYSIEEVRATSDWIRNLTWSCTPYRPQVGVVRDLMEGIVRVVAPLL